MDRKYTSMRDAIMQDASISMRDAKCKYAGMQLCNYASMQLCKYANMQVCK